MEEAKQVASPPAEANVQAAQKRYTAAQDAWESQVKPLGEKVAGHLGPAGGPNDKDAEALFNDLLPLVSRYPLAAMRLAQLQLGRYVEEAAVRAGLSPDDIRRLSMSSGS